MVSNNALNVAFTSNPRQAICEDLGRFGSFAKKFRQIFDTFEEIWADSIIGPARWSAKRQCAGVPKRGRTFTSGNSLTGMRGGRRISDPGPAGMLLAHAFTSFSHPCLLFPVWAHLRP